MSEAASLFDDIWQRIVGKSGEFFQTQAGAWFTYRIEADTALPSHTELRIPRSDFERVFPLLPLPSPAKIGKFVTGANYVWAILHDPRITEGRW